uniref:MyoD family inhibitor domain containing 2 n=2 Tax=Haplochromini TaxID=319058 RepID=A0A3B4F378_9CICH
MIAITFRQADKDRAHQEIVCKLQVSQKNNCLRVMFDEALRRNTQMLKEKEQQEAAQMQRKLQDPEKEMEALQEFINTDRLPTFDCAGIVLNCLFCRFYDMIHMLPDSCKGLANHCCPSYKHVITTAESASSSDDDSYIDLDCGVFGSCHDASDCLELAMEVSEICYH